MPDSKVNRIAEQKARQVELDIASGNFDSTLKKYKPEAALKRSQVSASGLFERFKDSIFHLVSAT